jgi:AcrR family transcriptional regulator
MAAKKAVKGATTKAGAAAVLEDYRVNAILDAAMEVIGSEGLIGATMQRIADRAGVAKGTVYLYFVDREDLMRRAASRVRETMREHARPLLSAKGPFEERLRALLGGALELLEKHRGFLRVYALTPRAKGERARLPCKDVADPVAPQALDDLRGFLERAMRRGEIRHTDPTRLAAFIHASMTALAFRRLAESRPASVEADLSWIVGMLLHGMLPRGRSSS